MCIVDVSVTLFGFVLCDTKRLRTLATKTTTTQEKKRHYLILNMITGYTTRHTRQPVPTQYSTHYGPTTVELVLFLTILVVLCFYNSFVLWGGGDQLLSLSSSYIACPCLSPKQQPPMNDQPTNHNCYPNMSCGRCNIFHIRCAFAGDQRG